MNIEIVKLNDNQRMHEQFRIEENQKYYDTRSYNYVEEFKENLASIIEDIDCGNEWE